MGYLIAISAPPPRQLLFTLNMQFIILGTLFLTAVFATAQAEPMAPHDVTDAFIPAENSDADRIGRRGDAGDSDVGAYCDGRPGARCQCPDWSWAGVCNGVGVCVGCNL
ncbi:hypothetical protein FN846DRAFT_947696 [Sphaerosporella brunnea]|uniref:Uncharacterized protein n=1 Tax=Sphaerosporella brunnea TaxID=1250544 RepID=A0A5J5EYA3_9PEZI|nr:hypothetical protein FN846DRAFT_947696 [Sphaerosporella brunnea]